MQWKFDKIRIIVSVSALLDLISQEVLENTSCKYTASYEFPFYVCIGCVGVFVMLGLGGALM